MTDFAKYQALGNDYLIVDPHDVDFSPTAESVRLLCDRHFGIGADGVLIGPTAPVEPGRPIRLRIFNSDGSECEKSGNGIRMFALYVADRYGLGDEFVVRTVAGDSPVRIHDLDAGIVQVAMGVPVFEALRIPVLGVTGKAISYPLDVDGTVWTATSLNIGNPHTVIPLPDISAELARELGPRVATHVRLPHGSNVQLLQAIDKATIQIEIWERGSGYTLASGSSSCAAASAARALGLVGDDVSVRMPGGEIQIGFDAAGAVTMTGAAEPVATGTIADALWRRLAAASERGAP